MAEPSELKVEVEGRYIVITMSGSSLSASYFKSAIAPGLVPSDYMRDDKDAGILRQEFLDRAWQSANNKARELGWIA